MLRYFYFVFFYFFGGPPPSFPLPPQTCGGGAAHIVGWVSIFFRLSPYLLRVVVYLWVLRLVGIPLITRQRYGSICSIYSLSHSTPPLPSPSPRKPALQYCRVPTLQYCRGWGRGGRGKRLHLFFFVSPLQYCRAGGRLKIGWRS